MKNIFNFTLILIIILNGCVLQEKKTGNSKTYDHREIAPTPPMGWNSYDCYDWRVNEKEYKSNVDYLAENLLQHGYEYAVVDFRWHVIDTSGYKPVAEREKRSLRLKYDSQGNLIDQISVDKYGRVMPDTVRFPSASGGKGFKPLADYVHSKGLKFGIHIMRGVPRIAAKKHMPVKGTEYTAADIAEPWDTCTWENSMYGVNFESPGAQEYYNSLIELYASWGVDFIKADDIMNIGWHPEEIKMLHNAIRESGRPIVLSLSLGEPRFFEAQLLCDNANMWRISDDFWDEWDQIVRQFDLTKFWANYSGTGNWPDADMLPVGHLSLNGPYGEPRMSKFTWPEHYTLMTLWSISQSPLMIGANLPTTEDSTFFFLTNDEVLYVNQYSEKGHEIYHGWHDNTIIWIAGDTKSDDRFFALFNTGDNEKEILFDFEHVHLRDTYLIRDLWHHHDIPGEYKGSFTAKLPPHGAGLYRLSLKQ